MIYKVITPVHLYARVEPAFAYDDDFAFTKNLSCVSYTTYLRRLEVDEMVVLLEDVDAIDLLTGNRVCHIKTTNEFGYVVKSCLQLVDEDCTKQQSILKTKAFW